MSSPPSVDDAPAVEWPPPFTAISRPCSDAYFSVIEIASADFGMRHAPAGFSAAFDQRRTDFVYASVSFDVTNCASVSLSKPRSSATSASLIERLAAILRWCEVEYGCD